MESIIELMSPSHHHRKLLSFLLLFIIHNDIPPIHLFVLLQFGSEASQPFLKLNSKRHSFKELTDQRIISKTNILELVIEVGQLEYF